MNENETGKILSIISEMYPSFRKDRNIKATGAVWQKIFEHTPYAAVEQALMAYIATDTKGYPPVPGAINERILQAKELDGLTENDAWILVLKAVSREIYNSREEFEKLPEYTSYLDAVMPDAMRTSSIWTSFKYLLSGSSVVSQSCWGSISPRPL